MSPTKSLRDVRSRRISIFIVNTFVSLGCSSNTTRIMRRTLKYFILFFTWCETISIWKCVLVRFQWRSHGSRLNCAFWSAPGDWGCVSWLGINMARKWSIHYAGFPVRMKQALLRELEWLGSVVQCVTGSMTTSLQYRVNIVTTSSTCVEPGFCS